MKTFKILKFADHLVTTLCIYVMFKLTFPVIFSSFGILFFPLFVFGLFFSFSFIGFIKRKLKMIALDRYISKINKENSVLKIIKKNNGNENFKVTMFVEDIRIYEEPHIPKGFRFVKGMRPIHYTRLNTSIDVIQECLFKNKIKETYVIEIANLLEILVKKESFNIIE